MYPNHDFCRQRQDDKWKHDLYDDDEHQLYSMDWLCYSHMQV